MVSSDSLSSLSDARPVTDTAIPTVTPRYVQGRVNAAMQDTRVVLIVGPRQAGKTTLARQYANPNRPYLTLDDTATLAAAKSDPAGFIRGLPSAVIDEVQRAPDLLLAIKESVDKTQTPGRFLLTGSTNLMALPVVADSLAGRLAVITLLPFAQAELAGTPGDLLDRLFDGDVLPQVVNPVIGDELMSRVLKGGYPEVLRRSSASRQQAWLEDYVALILDRDVRDIAQIDQLGRMPRLLDVLAAHAGQLVNHSSYGAALGLTSPTAQKYVSILERLYLIHHGGTWCTKYSRSKILTYFCAVGDVKPSAAPWLLWLTSCPAWAASVSSRRGMRPSWSIWAMSRTSRSKMSAT